MLNINIGVALLIWSTHSHLCSALVEKREVAGEGGGLGFDLLVGFIFLSFGASILRKLLLNFSLQGFPRINICVLFCMVMLFYLSIISVYMLLL